MGTTAWLWFWRSRLVVICLIAITVLFIGVAAFGKEEKEFKASWYRWDKDYWPTEPTRGGILHMASSSYIGLMNPHHWPVNDWVAIGYFYELPVYNDGQYKPGVPWLMRSWKYDTPTTLITRFQQGVVFHDGTPCDAKAIKFNMDWINDRKSGAWSRSYFRPVESVEVVDDNTLKWTFKKPWAGFIGTVGYMFYLLSPKPLQEQGAKALDDRPAGTGPYVLREARPGDHLLVERNPNWWFGKSVGRPDMPYYDGIKITVIPDPMIRLANLRAGKIDVMGVHPSLYDKVKNDPKLNVYVNPTSNTRALYFNHAKGPCQDIRVRKAISHAIDRKALIDGIQFGFGRIASGIYPDRHYAHNPSLKPVNYDPELSKKLLAEAGFPNGLTVQGVMGNSTEAVTLTEAIKFMLKKVGIEWQVICLDSTAISDKLKNLEFDLCTGGWSYIFDPDTVATGLYHPNGGFNYGRSKNEKAIALIEAGISETDEAKRTNIYKELDKVLYDNYEDLWLWYDMSILAYRKVVQGYNHEMSIEGGEAYNWSHPNWFKNGRRE